MLRDGQTLRSLGAVSISRRCAKFGGNTAVTHPHHEAPGGPKNAMDPFHDASAATPQTPILDDDDDDASAIPRGRRRCRRVMSAHVVLSASKRQSG